MFMYIGDETIDYSKFMEIKEGKRRNYIIKANFLHWVSNCVLVSIGEPATPRSRC